MPQLYTYFKDAVEKGQGYTEGHFPTYEYFYYSLKEAHGIILEDKEKDEFICYIAITKTRISRSLNCKLNGGHMMMNPKYRGKNLGSFCLSLFKGIARSLGYEGMVSEALTGNLASLETYRRTPGEYAKIGYIPCVDKIGKLQDSCCVMYLNFSPQATPSFADLVHHSNSAKL